MGYETSRIQERLIPPSPARPGGKRQGFSGVTIHETGNYRRSADAESHAAYMAGSGKNAQVSSHYYVDDRQVFRCIPEQEVAWHASDGAAAPGGNMSTVSIEICVNWGYLPREYAGRQKDVKEMGGATAAEQADAMARFATAVEKAAQLAAEILHRNGVRSVDGYLHQHNHWDRKNRKDCPHNLRKGVPVGWKEFAQGVQQRLDALHAEKGGMAGEKEAPADNQPRLYRVQVGAFSRLQNAQELLARLKQDGYEGFIR